MNHPRLPERFRKLLTTVGERARSLRAEPRPEPPPRYQVGGPLDAINDDFHESYEQSRTEARKDVPVLLVLAHELVMFHRGERRVWSFTPHAFHVIKSVSHAPLAIFAELERLEDGRVHEAARARLTAQRARIQAALSRLADDAQVLPGRCRDDLRGVLVTCDTFLAALGDELERARLDDFARALGPVLLRLIDDATALQLEGLDAHAREALRALSADELAALTVVVTGDHQARVRSLGMQYFRRLLDEPEGVEVRVTYAEGVSDEQGALALVGTRRLDQAISRAFFGDERRLQRDILGDSARARLASSELGPLA